MAAAHGMCGITLPYGLPAAGDVLGVLDPTGLQDIDIASGSSPSGQLSLACRLIPLAPM